jgi:lactate dehydrogenase-like 2-hydroxyacid dehydrogenase
LGFPPQQATQEDRVVRLWIAVVLDVCEERRRRFLRRSLGQILQDDELARLLTFPNVLITAHQAFLTYEAMAEIARGWRRSNSRSSQ